MARSATRDPTATRRAVILKVSDLNRLRRRAHLSLPIPLRSRMRPVQRGLLHRSVPVCLRRNSMPPVRARNLRHGGDMFWQQCAMSRRPHRHGRHFMWRQRSRVRLWPMHVARPAVPKRRRQHEPHPRLRTAGRYHLRRLVPRSAYLEPVRRAADAARRRIAMRLRWTLLQPDVRVGLVAEHRRRMVPPEPQHRRARHSRGRPHRPRHLVLPPSVYLPSVHRKAQTPWRASPAPASTPVDGTAPDDAGGSPHTGRHTE